MLAKILNDKLKVTIVTDDQHLRMRVDQYKHSGIDVYETRVFAGIDEARRWVAGLT